MTAVLVNLLVNLFMVALLLLTISYCWVLNRRIKILQDSKSELAQLLRYFDESTQRASESIVALQSTSKRIGDNIQSRIDKANVMLDDLAFMIEKGNKIANQIEAGLAVQRARNRVPPPASAPVRTPVEEPPQSPTSDKPSPVVQGEPSTREKTTVALETVLERMVGRNKTVQAKIEQAVAEKTQPVLTQGRSKSEMELLAMLKAGMKG